MMDYLHWTCICLTECGQVLVQPDKNGWPSSFRLEISLDTGTVWYRTDCLVNWISILRVYFEGNFSRTFNLCSITGSGRYLRQSMFANSGHTDSWSVKIEHSTLLYWYFLNPWSNCQVHKKYLAWDGQWFTPSFNNCCVLPNSYSCTVLGKATSPPSAFCWYVRYVRFSIFQFLVFWENSSLHFRYFLWEKRKDVTFHRFQRWKTQNSEHFHFWEGSV